MHVVLHLSSQVSDLAVNPHWTGGQSISIGVDQKAWIGKGVKA